LPSLTTTIAPDLKTLLIDAAKQYEGFARGDFYPASIAAIAAHDRLLNLLQQANPWQDATLIIVGSHAYGWEESDRSRKGVRLRRYEAVTFA
jgi:hypothetical protein